MVTTAERDALLAPTHADGSRLNVAATGKAISQPAYALRPKVLEVDIWAGDGSIPVIEVNSEVSFVLMAGVPLRFLKSTWAGSDERRKILLNAGILPHSDLDEAWVQGKPDDNLDAAAAMWQATRIARGAGVSRPSEPERLGYGHAPAIWL